MFACDNNLLSTVEFEARKIFAKAKALIVVKILVENFLTYEF